MSSPEQQSDPTLAHYVHRPELQAAVTLQQWAKDADIEMDLASLVNTLPTVRATDIDAPERTPILRWWC